MHIYALPLHHGDKLIGSSGHRPRRRIYSRRKSTHLARDLLERAGARLSDCSDHAADCALEHRRTDRAHGHWMKALRTGRAAVGTHQAAGSRDVSPLAREVATLAESLNTARSAAELEARLRDTGESIWTADRLAVHVRARLEDGRLFVVSNREPYMHVRRGKSIEVNVPPAVWSRRSSPSSAPAMEPGLPTAPAMPISKRSTRTIVCRFRPTIRTTRCGASG